MTDTHQSRVSSQAGLGRTLWNALWPVLVAVLCGLVMHLAIGPWAGGYASTVMVACAINVVLAVSLTVVNGFAGQFSLGHAGFMAIGGYTAAGIVYYGSLLMWGDASPSGSVLSASFDEVAGRPWLAAGDALFVVACLVGGLMAAIAGYVVGLPSLRLRGDYLAIVTLGFGEIVRVLLQGTKGQIQPWKMSELAETPGWRLPLHLGGPQGFNLLPVYTTLFWATAAMTLSAIVIYRLKYSALGREFLSVREDEIAAQAMGVNVTRAKVRAFVVAATFAGIAGGLYGHLTGTMNATELDFKRSIEIVIMVVLGGMGSISGAAMAAVLLTILPELLRDPPAIWPAGLLVLAIVTFTQWRRRRFSWPVLTGIIVATIVFEVGRRVAIAHAVDLADYRLVIYALLLILMMLLRPDGLFGVHEFWDVLGLRRVPRPGIDGRSEVEA
ncbi:MAG: branched-chain amino acid ABC transporter permease [Planctomycetaceae bacterium]